MFGSSTSTGRSPADQPGKTFGHYNGGFAPRRLFAFRGEKAPTRNAKRRQMYFSTVFFFSFLFSPSLHVHEHHVSLKCLLPTTAVEETFRSLLAKSIGRLFIFFSILVHVWVSFKLVKLT